MNCLPILNFAKSSEAEGVSASYTAHFGMLKKAAEQEPIITGEIEESGLHVFSLSKIRSEQLTVLQTVTRPLEGMMTMENALFDDLVQSLKEAKDIAKGKVEPSRSVTLEAPDVKEEREKMGDAE